LLVFIDESYKVDSTGVLQHVIGGIGIEEHRYRALEAGVHQIRGRWLQTRDGLTQEEVRPLLDTKLLVNGDPENFELKGQDLLQNRRLNAGQGGRISPSVLIVEECLQLARNCRATSFGVLSNPTNIGEVQSLDACPIQYVRLLDCINRWMLDIHPDRMAIPVFDTIHGGTNSHLSRQIGRYLWRHALGQQMKKIVPSPFWIDSKSTAGSQVADIVSHILMNSMLPPQDRKPLEFLWPRITDLETAGEGYRTISRLRKRIDR